MDVNRGGGLRAENIRGQVEVNESELKRFNVKRGDVFFTRTSETLDEIGFSAVALDNFRDTVFSGFVLRARPKGEFLIPEYSQHCFKTQAARKEIMEKSSYTTRALTSGSLLNHVNINLPPLPEQKRIVAVLEVWDSYLEKLGRKIEIKKRIKKGLMQQLLTGKKRLNGYRSKWEVKPFGDMVSLRRENFNPSKNGTEEFCIELEHIESMTGQIIGNITAGQGASIKSVFYEGDVLFGKLRAYLRKYWLAKRRGVCSTEVWVLAPKKDVVTSNYLFQIVKTDQFAEIASTTYGTHMPRSDWGMVANYMLPLPTLSEQAAISNVLRKADDEIEAFEKKRKIVEAQKKYLLNNLIAGNIRTPEDLLDKRNGSPIKTFGDDSEAERAMTSKGRGNGRN